MIFLCCGRRGFVNSNTSLSNAHCEISPTSPKSNMPKTPVDLSYAGQNRVHSPFLPIIIPLGNIKTRIGCSSLGEEKKNSFLTYLARVERERERGLVVARLPCVNVDINKSSISNQYGGWGGGGPGGSEIPLRPQKTKAVLQLVKDKSLSFLNERLIGVSGGPHERWGDVSIFTGPAKTHRFSLRFAAICLAATKFIPVHRGRLSEINHLQKLRPNLLAAITDRETGLAQGGASRGAPP
ncbi:hypothetical protein CDAR_289981 [Caerostris darwini]|uniref:Uncharacterized protein n=1 Tax=Caerostris darwini TaxID=1538125 RepID=A0AAV4WZK1_9ARAC|nr:hypothetical protein CDAR_289981 [Caerostris darwini]